MALSAKSRSRRDFIVEQDADGLNDNIPGIHPGHEMPELRNAQRQPAAEAVIHYARLSLIESFPEHPQAQKTPAADAPPMDHGALEKQASEAKPSKRSVAAACLTSFAFHAIVFTALAIGFVVTPHDPEEEAGEAVSVVILGDSEADQASAGDPDLEVEPQPDQVVAETVPPEPVQPTDQPTEVPPETVQPTQAEAVPPTQEVTRVSPETVTAAEPEVLTSNVPAETSVVQPVATAAPEELKPVEPVETAEALPEPVRPQEAPTPTTKPRAERPKPVEKNRPPKKMEKKLAGSQGENKQDSRRGASDGYETANSDQNSRSAGSAGGAGSAAVANYPGKVQSRIRRAVKVPAEYKRMSASMSVRVRLTIGGDGSLAALSVARSSGIPELDQAVVAGVRRASPFPPLPSEWGKPSWTFTQDVQISGRR
ncbi:TonB family protein [Rhizobium sp. SEMIA 4085]|uniref:TonB family transporter protein n=1 Tax=Rhizobium gallicum bv. gallicum R602sp TaxID=1041138 RepID=A0A0B4X6L8_9HYPH|nr:MULTISPECIES: energy transducer TonB [Rhizobium]AJD42188.1 TonB family transporter protein [Rhizobium gallicum bv. gallicum R602sp]NNH31623.1 TonB family protein [Rhizobium sp. SEMIA 4085]